jgi:hypothetical protein
MSDLIRFGQPEDMRPAVAMGDSTEVPSGCCGASRMSRFFTRCSELVPGGLDSDCNFGHRGFYSLSRQAASPQLFTI